MKDNSIDIKAFLATSPNVMQILNYIEQESQRIVAEQRKAESVLHAK